MKSERQIAAGLLEQVLSGALLADQAQLGWPKNASDDRSLHAAMHALQHYRVDADIRAKDERYSKWQTDQMRQIADDPAADRDVDSRVLDALELRPGCLFGMFGRRRR